MLLVKLAGPQKVSEAIAVLGSALYQHCQACWAFRKSLASDRVARAPTLWISSFNANLQIAFFFFLLLLHLSCFLLQVQVSEGWCSGNNIEFKLRALIHDLTHLCPPNWNSFWYVYSYPAGGNLVDFTFPWKRITGFVFPYFTFPTDNHHPQSRTW